MGIGGGPFNLKAVVDFYSVVPDREFRVIQLVSIRIATETLELHIEGLPYAGCPAHVHTWGRLLVEGTALVPHAAQTIAVEYLNLIVTG